MTSPRILTKAWNVQAKKSLGQNFLSDPSTAKMIVTRAKIGSKDIILEVGAGLGALTAPLSQAARDVYAIETDGRLISILNAELLAQDCLNVKIFKHDILDFDLEAFIKEQGIDQKIIVVGNLPYNISSQILIRLMKNRHLVSRAVIMLQKELTQRLIAEPGSKDYSRLTAMLKYCASVRSVATVAARMFYPKPKVDSEIIEVIFSETPEYPADDEVFLFKVIKAAFGQRRKNLRNSLAGSEFHIEPELARLALEDAGIDPKRRAETLNVQEFVNLGHALAKQIE